MKKLKSAVWGTALALCALMANSSVAFAAEKGAESVRITPSAYLNSYTIRINGTEVKSGEGYDLSLIHI